ncbi:VOC family protein [Bacillus sp. DX4.1]|uniref:VOC family protein n=1 Tax=Bacillus sp. DX4.1 TaxID=3055867 RepID=UPI0025A2E2E5|nr:VOC family protein [Bacillus sp. DX4.1]MDM5189191.1 VOC family protein [Bacillus sp. DX4.1]
MVQIHPETRIGHVEFKVKDLERQITFYESVVGLEVIKKEGKKAYLAGKGGGKALLVLEQLEDAILQEPRTTGIYHIAFLVPTREAFASALFGVIRNKKVINSPEEQEGRYTYSNEILPISRFNSASDHTYSEAFYLQDLEGNGIEIYADRPRDQWSDGPGGSTPLDLKELATLVDYDFEGLPAETVVGHVHLRIADVEKSHEFYVETVGFEQQQREEDCLFISAGGYHHHIGANTWNGINNPHPPAHATGLKVYTIVLPHEEALHELQERLAAKNHEVTEVANGFTVIDPSGITVQFEVEK